MGPRPVNRSDALTNVPYTFHFRMMGNHRLDLLCEVARHGFTIEVSCRVCPWTIVLDPKELGARLDRPGEFGVKLSLAQVGERARCSICGKRGAQVTPSQRPVDRQPTERELRRMRQLLRG